MPSECPWRDPAAAIANAEAVELDASHPKEVQGWAEVPRRRLTAGDLAGILGREADELRAAADDFERRGARARPSGSGPGRGWWTGTWVVSPSPGCLLGAGAPCPPSPPQAARPRATTSRAVPRRV